MLAQCNQPTYWTGCYQGTYDLWHPDSYCHPAKMSVPLAFKIMSHLKELSLLKDSDVILDPMAGICTTGIVASALSHKFIGVELEEKFVNLAKQNREYASRKLYKEFDWQIIQGDARKLSKLLGERGLVTCTSPPYGNEAKGLSQEEYDKKQDIVNKERLNRGDIRGGIGRSGALGISIINPDGYGTTPGQIGNMRDKPLKAITSPPHFDTMSDWDRKSRASLEGISVAYSDEVGKATRENIGNIHYYDEGEPVSHKYSRAKEGDETYLSAMLTVYQEIAKVSDVLAIAIKNPTRAGKLRRLDLDTIKLLEMSGWRIHCQHRAVLFEEQEEVDLFGETKRKVKGRLSFFKRLAWQKGQPVAAWEDILIAVRKE